MVIINIADVDLTPYQTCPLLPTESTASLGFDLHSCMPDDAPLQVQKAAKRMLASASAIEEVFTTRVELAGVDLNAEVAFDSATDRFWVAVRNRCYYWMYYAHEGLDLLTKAQQDKIDLEDKREKAELARELDKHLFGIDGLKFLSKRFSQQVVLMASRLKFIAGSEKFSDYEELIGPELLNMLNVLQERYKEMVRDRSARGDDGSDLKLLRYTLQRHITLYASAVLGMIDEDEPESIEMVLEALQPMVNTRADRPRSAKDNAKPKTEPEPEPETEGEPLPAEAIEPAIEPAAENDDSE
jgi:hypothetical protein